MGSRDQKAGIAQREEGIRELTQKTENPIKQQNRKQTKEQKSKKAQSSDFSQASRMQNGCF